MNKYEFEAMLGDQITDSEFRKIEKVFMNTNVIETRDQMLRIVKQGGMEFVDILYSMVEERKDLIEWVGKLKTDLSDARKEIRSLRNFRDAIIAEANRHLDK